MSAFRPIAGWLLLIASSPWAWAQAVLTHVTDPTPPGRLCTLVGDGWSAQQPAVRAWRLPDADPGEPPAGPLADPEVGQAAALPVLKQEPQVLVCRLPRDRFGVFAVQVRSADAWGPPLLINRARAQWLIPDRAEPGQTVRIIGCNLVDLGLYPERDAAGRPVSYGAYVKSTTRATLRGPAGKSARVRPAAVAKASAYDVHIELPKDLAAGRYEVFVHNGLAGPWGWSEPLALDVHEPKPWPDRVFNVRDFGAQGDGLADDAPAIQAALAAAGQNGGGLVYLPAGSYLINATLTVPRRTTVRGDSADRTWIWLPNGVHYGTREAGMALEVGLTGDGDFVLEDLTLHGVYVRHLVQAPVGFADREAPPAENVVIRRCRLMVEPTLRHPYRKGDPFLEKERLDRDSNWCYRFVVCLRGDYCRVEDCHLRSGGTAVHLKGSRQVTLARNEILQGTGAAFIIFPSSRLPEQIVIEDNTTRPVSNVHTATLWSHVKAKRYYIARNRFELDWCRDNECMCWHSLQYRVAAHVRRADGLQLTVDTEDFRRWLSHPRNRPGFLDAQTGQAKPDALKGFECLVIQGRGLGQWRTITANTDDTLTLDRPWTIPPAPGSLVVLTENPSFEGHIVVDNVLEHTGSGIAPWGNSIGLIADGNRLSRSGGVDLCDVGAPNTYREWGGHYFAQLIHNTVSVGRYHARWPVRQAAHIFQSVLGWDPQGASIGVAGLGNVVRSNRTESDAFIAMTNPRGAPIQGTIIEDNDCVDCRLGVWVGRGTSGVLADNRFVNVEEPLRDDESAMAIHPAVRLQARLAGVAVVARQMKQDLGPSWAAIEQQAGRLLSLPADDPGLPAACEAILKAAWKATAAVKHPLQSRRLLESLVGLSVEPEKNQPLHGLLARGQGGQAALLLNASMAPGVPAVDLAMTPQWPEGWQSGPASPPTRLTPGAPAALKLPVTVPPGAWGPYTIGLAIQAVLDGTAVPIGLSVGVGRGDIGQWLVIGPFPNVHKEALDTTLHAPEERLDVRAEYASPLLPAGQARWQPWTAGPWIDFAKLYGRQADATAFAVAAVRADAEVSATLTFAVHGTGQAWLGDELLETFAEPTTRARSLRLAKGDNILLVKLSARAGRWALNVQVASSDPNASGRLHPVPASELGRLPALCPPPLAQAPIADLKHAGSVAWRLVHEDRFDRRQIGPDYRVGRGSWKLREGVLVGSEQAFIAWKDKLTAPVRIEYDARSDNPSDLSAFWLADPADYGSGYLFAFASGNTWNRVTISNDTPASSEHPLAKPGRWHHVIAQVLPRGLFELIVDDQLAVRGQTAKPPTAALYPGLWTWGQAEFDNLRLYTGVQP